MDSYVLYILCIIASLIALGTYARVKLVFGKYSKVRSISQMTGADTAYRMLQAAGIHDVEIWQIKGRLTDHYDPLAKKLCLSEEVFNSCSVAAIGVAAHECGHALQHQESYVPLKIRSLIFPLANFGSRFGVILIIVGLLIDQIPYLFQFGIILFSFAVLFQLVTLPVEFNATKRAIVLTEQYGILQPAEMKDCKKVLKAAAMTYVATAAVSVLQLLRYISINRD